MAQVTWKATVIGAVILFLIGLVVATCLNYADACISSIKAGLDGPFDCSYQETINKTIKCDKDDFNTVQACLYVFVTYTNPDTGETTDYIKYSLSYRYERAQTINYHRQIYDGDGNEMLLGKCSANYCGTYRYKNESGEYLDHPELIEAVQRAEEQSSSLTCYLNPNKPKDGAYLFLNDAVPRPERRVFKYYEAWIILVSPLVVLFVILLSLFILFFKGNLAAAPIVRRKETFIPPGFQPVPSSASGQSSLKSINTKDNKEENRPVPV